MGWQIATIMFALLCGVLTVFLARQRLAGKTLGDTAKELAARNLERAKAEALRAVRESEDQNEAARSSDREKAEEEINRADDPTRDIYGRPRE